MKNIHSIRHTKLFFDLEESSLEYVYDLYTHLKIPKIPLYNHEYFYLEVGWKYKFTPQLIVKVHVGHSACRWLPVDGA